MEGGLRHLIRWPPLSLTDSRGLNSMLLGQGVYSYRDAASLTKLRTARIREWFNQRALFQSDFVSGTEQHLISFLDLVDVFIAGKLRDMGLSMQTLRRIYATLQTEFSVSHPFGRSELLTDGKRVFLCGLDARGKDEVVDVLTRQKAFPEVIRPFLKELHFDRHSKLADKWRISKGVVVNPLICFGQPVVEEKGIPTHLIAQSARANKNDLPFVADWYGMTVAQVRHAIHFEKTRAA